MSLSRSWRRLALVLAALVLLAVYVHYARQGQSDCSEPAELLALGWGNGQREAGKGIGRDGRAYGPCSFAVDRGGRVVIADSYNTRVLRFGPGGEWMGAVSIPIEAGTARPLLEDVAISKDDSIFLADSRTRKLWLLKGSSFESIPFPDIPAGVDVQKGDISLLAGLWASKGELILNEHYSAVSGYHNWLWVYETGRRRWRPFSVLCGTSMTEGVAGGVGMVTVGHDGLVYSLSWEKTDPRGYDLRTYSRSEKLLRTSRLSNVPEGAQLIGADKKSSLFLAKKEADQIHVWKLNKAASVTSHLVLPWKDSVSSATWARVDETGNLYLSRGEEDGFRIYFLSLP